MTSPVILVKDTTVLKAVTRQDPSIEIRSGGFAVLRSTKLDGSGVVTLYYEGPDLTFDNQATDDSGSVVTLTPSNPERMINVPGKYRVAVTSASTTAGVVFVDR